MSLIKSFGGFVKNARYLISLANKYYVDTESNEELEHIKKLEEIIIENPMIVVSKYGDFLCVHNDQIEDTTFYNIESDDIFISAIQEIWVNGNKSIKNTINSTLNNMIELYIDFDEQSITVRTYKVVDIISDFNRIIKKIGNEMSSLFPTDDVVIRAKKRTALAIDQFPTWIINEVGMHLFKYYEQIERKDVNFFLENSYDREMSKTVKTNPDTAKLSEYLIPKIKETWRSIDKNKQAIYYKNVFMLLTHYVEFLIVR
jgi:hypothetical protein